MCLAAHVSSQTRLIVAIQGKTDSNQLLNILQRALNEQGALMVAERNERETRVFLIIIFKYFKYYF